MSENAILTKEEFLKRAGLSEAQLHRWIERGLILPVGQTPTKVPYFEPGQQETVKKILTLLELGYDEDTVVKITQKIGLPSVNRDRKSPPDKLMTIGELAQTCELNSRTIKHWEEKELLQPDARSEGGFRLYGSPSIERCKRILDLQHVGYTLEQIRAKRELLIEPDTLLAALRSDLSEERIVQLEEYTSALKTRIETVRGSAKRLDDLCKRRGKIIGNLKSQLAKKKKDSRSESDARGKE